jgi:hypothetical protein
VTREWDGLPDLFTIVVQVDTTTGVVSVDTGSLPAIFSRPALSAALERVDQAADADRFDTRLVVRGAERARDEIVYSSDDED